MENLNKLIAHACVINNKNEILLIRRTCMKNNEENYQPLKWDFPGGTVEPCELPLNAAIRETKEEVGLDIQIDTILYEKSKFDSRKNAVFTTLIYLTQPVENNIIIQLDLNEHDLYKWIPCPTLSDNKKFDLVDYVLPSLLKIISFES